MMKKFSFHRLCIVIMLFAGFMIAWCTAMPSELGHEQSRLLGGSEWEPWCPCKGDTPWELPCESMPGENCEGRPSWCNSPPGGGYNGSCESSGEICTDSKKCEDGPYHDIYCTEDDE